MKRILILLTAGAIIACPALLKAQDDPAPPPGNAEGPGGPGVGGPGGHHHDLSFLTDAEKAELKKAHDAAIAADPSLAEQEKANQEAMEQAHQSGQPPTEDQRAAFKAFRDKMDAAMIKADPAVAPIIEKIKAHHHGPPPPPPASGT